MADYPNERDCHHGQLKRSCPMCELEQENQELLGLLRSFCDAVTDDPLGVGIEHTTLLQLKRHAEAFLPPHQD